MARRIPKFTSCHTCYFLSNCRFKDCDDDCNYCEKRCCSCVGDCTKCHLCCANRRTNYKSQSM